MEVACSQKPQISYLHMEYFTVGLKQEIVLTKGEREEEHVVVQRSTYIEPPHPLCHTHHIKI